MAGTSHVLARKYRPQVFADLIGQDALVRTITNAIATNRLAHAYLLTGIRGVGKTSSARIIAKGLNCIGPDGQGGMTANPCGKCQHCIDIANDSHIDVIEIDAASNTGVDNIREIIEGAKYNPVSARFKIYIIDEVHMLSKPAFNALLKTLEEPPERIKFILATTEVRKVPVTILSRCQRFDLKRLDTATLTNHLASIAQKENVSAEPDALKLLAQAGGGSVRDSLSLMDQAMTQLQGNLTTTGVRQMLGLADKTALLTLFDNLMQGKINTALTELDSQYAAGADPFEIVQDLLNLTHWLTKVKIIPQTASDITLSEAERALGQDLAKKLSMGSLNIAWQVLLKGLQEVRSSDIPLQALEMVLIRLAYLSDLPPPAEILAEAKKKSLTPPPAVKPAPALTDQPAPAPVQSAPAQPQCAIHTLQDIVALARKKGERVLAFQVETGIRPVALSPGQIQCVLTPDSPRDLSARLTQFLTKTTGINWILQAQVSGGGQTLHEVKEAKQSALIAELKQTPTVNAVLSAFSGAKIDKVRPHKPVETSDEVPVEDNTDLDD